MDETFLSQDEPKKPMKKKKKKMAAKVKADPKHTVHVNVNVVNTAGHDGHKKGSNAADQALDRLRGY